MDTCDFSEIWKTNLIWETGLTPCLENTILVWIPCGFLWTFSLVEASFILRSKDRNISWNWFNSTKLIVTCLLIILTIFDIVEHKNSSSFEYYTPIIKICTFILSIIIVICNKNYGFRSSKLLLLFWLILVLGAIPQLKSIQIDEPSSSITSFITFFSLCVIMMILNCFTDPPTSNISSVETDNCNPENNCSFLQRIFCSHISELIYLGYNRTIVRNDLWPLNKEDKSSHAFNLFDKYWRRSLKQIKKCYININVKSGNVVSILPSLCKAFGDIFLFGALLKIFENILAFSSPLLLGLLISFAGSNDNIWKGYLYAVSLFIFGILKTIAESQYQHRMNNVGFRIRSSLMSAMYRKSLRLSAAARKQFTVGEIVNLMSVDVYKFVELMNYIHTMWSAPIQVTLAMYLLWQILGPSSLAGLAVMILLIPINGYLTNKNEEHQVKLMDQKDERVKIMNEILNGIKILKLYAWEKCFESQVLKIRSKEIGIIKQYTYNSAITTFLWGCAPFLVALASFAVFVLSDSSNVLDSKTVFVSISLFNILRHPLGLLPFMLSFFVQTLVSAKRLSKYMNAAELDPANVTIHSSNAHAISIEKGTFSWGEETILKNITMNIAPGSLVAVVGAVGAGKSSLMSALLGNMNKLAGCVSIRGSVSYVPQQAWIQNCSLRDNVLFGKDYDEDSYLSVLNGCALAPDLLALPAGDRTEIGEKGINLSGGQKQRISLARAIYADSDVYLLDDPLSAVDAHVGSHIFNSVIGPAGALRSKTRVLVTHSVMHLREMDVIVVMKDGEVAQMGSYGRLMEERGDFADFLEKHSVEKRERDLGHHHESSAEIVNESETQSCDNENQSSEKFSNDDKLIDEECIETGSVKWQTYTFYFASFSIFLTVSTIVANILTQIFSIGSNVWLGIWSSNQDMINNNESDASGRIGIYLGVYTCLGIGQAISTFFQDLLPQFGCLEAAQVMHDGLLHNILRSPMSFFDTTPVGRMLSRFSKDVENLDWQVPYAISTAIYTMFDVFGIILVISVTTPMFTSMIIPIIIFYYFIQRFYVSSSRQLKRLESVSRSPIFSHFGESIAGVTTIRAYKVQERFISKLELLVDDNHACHYLSLLSNRWLAIRLEILGNFIILFAALFAVHNRDSLNPAIVGLSITYALQITNNLNALVMKISEIETDIVSAERIKEYSENKTEAPWDIPSTSSSDWPSEGAVEIDKLVIRYRSNNKPVLHGISCKIKAGEKVGIVGRTGAGKSTLTLAFFRILEASEGNISIDSIDISTLGLHFLRSRLTIIPQDPVLFMGSLRMNLDPFNSFSDDEVWQALKRAHLKAFVEGLSADLNHHVTEGGENLSVGQRQLICLARALLRRTKVLILDEATAAVDLETDDLIQQTIHKEFNTCTIITIAHRLNTIMDSNRILVLDKGMICEFDTPANLLQNNTSLFYNLARDAGIVKP